MLSAWHSRRRHGPRTARSPAPPVGVFTRLALGMAVLGICIGAVFPYFAEFLVVPTQYSRASTFRLCLAAGIGPALDRERRFRSVVQSSKRRRAGRTHRTDSFVSDSVADLLDRPAQELPGTRPWTSCIPTTWYASARRAGPDSRPPSRTCPTSSSSASASATASGVSWR